MARARWSPPQVPFMRGTGGVSDNGLYASIARGETMVIDPGVYIATNAWPSDEVVQHQLHALARQMRWPHLVSSHETAALTHAQPLLNTARAVAGQPRFTRAPGAGARSSRQPRVTVRELPLDAVTEVLTGVAQGLRVTTPARTALDLAAELDLPEALMLTDDVARRALRGFRGGSEEDLSDAARQASMRPLKLTAVSPVHDRRKVQRVLALTDALRDSPAESGSFGWFALAGLPLPRCQVRIETEDGVARVDFYWEDFGLVGECDGRIKYDGTYGPEADVNVRQNIREQALRDRGFVVVRWTAEEIMFYPQRVVQRVAERLFGLGWSGSLIRV